jgi:hypothetical protein
MHRLQSGFALVEAVLTLLIASAMIPITILCMRPIGGMLAFDEELQDAIALAQLRRIFLLSYDIQSSANEIQFTYQQKEWNLTFKNDRLILSPGTQIFLSKLDDCFFLEKDQCLYVSYTRGAEQYEKVLCETD